PDPASAVVAPRADHAGAEGAVVGVWHAGRALHPVPRAVEVAALGDHAGGQVLVVGVEAVVDDGDGHAGAPRVVPCGLGAYIGTGRPAARAVVAPLPLLAEVGIAGQRALRDVLDELGLGEDEARVVVQVHRRRHRVLPAVSDDLVEVGGAAALAHTLQASLGEHRLGLRHAQAWFELDHQGPGDDRDLALVPLDDLAHVGGPRRQAAVLEGATRDGVRAHEHPVGPAERFERLL